jgi:hypothetical protein
MASSASEAGAPDEKRVACPVCGELIASRAQKCVHCCSELTWRKYLTFSNTSLALVTALIAVVGATAPAIHTLLTPKNSAMRANFSGADPDGKTISVLVSNDGRRTGAVNRLALTVDFGDHRGMNIEPRTKDDTAIFVDPEKTIGVTFYFANATIQMKSADSIKDLSSAAIAEERLLKSTTTIWVRFVDSTGHVSDQPLSLSNSGLSSDFLIPIFRHLSPIQARFEAQ